MEETCIKCKRTTVKDSNKWIMCDCCHKWEHIKCTYLKDVPNKCIGEIPFYCDICAIKLQCTMKENIEMKETINEMKSMMEILVKDMKIVKAEISNTSAQVNTLGTAELHSFMNAVMKEINGVKYELRTLKNKEKTEELNDKLEIVTSELKNVTNNIEVKKVKSSYADTLKSKNMLIVKSLNSDKTAFENKKGIMSNVKTPVESVTETKDGHIAVRFDSKKKLEQAKKELTTNSAEEITISEKGKMKPKIKLVNVSKDDDDVINSIIMKNRWISDFIEDEEDLMLKREDDARNNQKKHCFIKCSPKIRKAIYDHGDKLYTMYEHCKIFYSYQPYQCYKCQEYGHSAEKCQNKQTCPKCGGEHRYKDCQSEDAKCVNCSKRGLENADHRTFDGGRCTVYNAEVARIKNNTDHGFG